ncbi:MAG: hypothetical protein A2408_00405 [Candidatus Yonathbacteria bacterium RIFOXYC1_FULL_52_10]|uniref:Uncharacterized protein n=1 Tax=Candidatus Yonathbacteria bacterium RIFOXYD1_FULL_52_36 TaxID=1802730 RepID=A0A1G2SN89_9BACT|nr:MAG: hypothetical protein A2408_00405 [Candidatus Yonathbacteria bacterium RIFOXYC1_FULL_52_10]OHA86272.1 MAG: hypothetical protein A2591_01775 [Candidatus Yonathbacteria bacterium RIFOXYD1_FULL_52_36]
MTLVLAANLSDRIYVSCDSRLSRRQKDNSSEVITDDLLKVFPLNNESTILVGCVGNLQLIQFLISELNKSEFKDIRSLRKGIEDRVRLLLDKYMTKRKEVTYDQIVGSLIFAGSSSSQKRILEAEKLKEHVKYCQNLDQAYLKSTYTTKIEKMPPQEIMALANDLNQRQAGLKHIILEGLMQTAAKHNGKVETFEINLPDQHLFVVDINGTKQVPNEVVLVHDVDWGHYIARGGGHNEAMLPRDFFCNLDFKQGAGDIWRDVMPFVEYTYSNYSDVIEGTIVTAAIFKGNILVPVGSLFRIKQNSLRETVRETVADTRINEKQELEHRKNGEWRKLIRVSDYLSAGNNYM